MYVATITLEGIAQAVGEVSKSASATEISLGGSQAIS